MVQTERNPETEDLQSVLDTWWECYMDAAVTLKTVDHDLKMYAQGPGIQKYTDLRDALAAWDPYWNGRQLNMKSIGNKLRTYQGRRLGDTRFVRGKDTHTKTATWRIEKF
jgi:hypothetical protein